MSEILYTITIKFNGKKPETIKDLSDAKATKLEKEAWKNGAHVVEVFQQKRIK